VSSLWSFPALSTVSGHSLHCLQSLVIPCTVCSLWSFPVLCPQSLVISCTVSAVSGHSLYCPQSLVIPCTVSAVSGASYGVKNTIFFFFFSKLGNKPSPS
ncbi:unnamed protein product, partial [Staurois parvus]